MMEITIQNKTNQIIALLPALSGYLPRRNTENMIFHKKARWRVVTSTPGTFHGPIEEPQAKYRCFCNNKTITMATKALAI